MATAAEPVDLQCLIAEADECRATMAWIKSVQALLAVAVALATRWLARELGASRRRAWLLGALVGCGPTVISNVDSMLNTLPAMALITTQSALLVRLRRGDTPRRDWVLLGVASGLLLLTRAIFMFVVPMTLALAILVGGAARRREFARGAVVVVVIAAALASPWVIRNAIVVDSVALADGGADVLAVRAEASTMRWVEYPFAFAAYTPHVGFELLSRYVPLDYWGRWDRRNPVSFYELAVGRIPGGEVQTLTAEIGSQQEAAIRVAVGNFPKSVALTLPYAYRGVLLKVRGTELAENANPVYAAYGRLAEIPFGLWHVLMPWIVVVGLWRARREGHHDRLWAALPVLALVAVHATLTHFLQRYGEPMLPVLYLLALQTVRPGWFAADGAYADRQ